MYISWQFKFGRMYLVMVAKKDINKFKTKNMCKIIGDNDGGFIQNWSLILAHKD